MSSFWIVILGCYWVLLGSHGSGLSTAFGLSMSCSTTRRQFYKGVSAFVPMVAGTESWIVPASAAQDPSSSRDDVTMLASTGEGSNNINVAYKTVTLNIPNYGVQIPVACWFPTTTTLAGQSNSLLPQAKYRHRISVRRIGELLAGWEFIPEFASKSFEFSPKLASGSLVNGERLSLPSSDSKVVILSHGFLGSRFDLSHIAEDLASQGFVCFSPEYPESLAASYQRVPGLDRDAVNKALLEYVETTVQPTAYGVVGHSLGCGTALRLGDSSWARVLIAGPPAPEDCPSPVLLITSTNDVFVRRRPLMIPPAYYRLQEGNLPSTIPRTSALVFDRPNGPNHISYLSENVNDAMVSFLSPLLPLAQAMSIPVLDFDTYQTSRDAKPTGAIIRPLISSFMVQQMASSIQVR